jgi:hypothetical protein
MSKMLTASAAILLIASASADAGMLLYEDANDSKAVVNNWAGQSFDPIAREVRNGMVVGLGVIRHPTAINSQADRRSAGARTIVGYRSGTSLSHFREDPFGD